MASDEMVLSRAYEVVAEVVAKMPVADMMRWLRWLRWCVEHDIELTVRPDGELFEIAAGGQVLVVGPKAILTDPDVTTFSVLGPASVPDDISELEGK